MMRMPSRVRRGLTTSMISVQAAIINLLVDIQAKRGATLVFISHDLSVVRYLADHVAVIPLGPDGTTEHLPTLEALARD